MLDLAWTFEARMNPFCGLDEIDTMEGTDAGNGDDDLGVDGDIVVDETLGLGGNGDGDGDHGNGDDDEEGDWSTIWSVFETH